ncbi:MAG: hypothetical protein NBV65_08150 [Burkholderiaceae bacterium]|nr:hypothetical protein [Burkholderiaceae bacterium]
MTSSFMEAGSSGFFFVHPMAMTALTELAQRVFIGRTAVVGCLRLLKQTTRHADDNKKKAREPMNGRYTQFIHRIFTALSTLWRCFARTCFFLSVVLQGLYLRLVVMDKLDDFLWTTGFCSLKSMKCKQDKS